MCAADRDLFAIAKFLLKRACIVTFFIRSCSEHIATLAVIGELYACKCACMAYFGNGNFCLERGGGFLSFRTVIPDGPGHQQPPIFVLEPSVSPKPNELGS